MKRRATLLLALCVAAGGVAFNLWLALQNRATWHVDFNQFYAAGELAGSGRLYDWARLQELQLRHLPTAVPTGRLPIFAFFLKPLSYVPYETARIVWLAISIAAIVLFVIFWPARNRLLLAAALCWSLPLMMCLAFGQDVPLFACAFAGGVICLRKRRSFAAGALFSLCASKFHLASGIVTLVVGRRDWRAVAGGVVGVAVLLAASYAIEGVDWTNRWLEMSRMPDFDPAAARMPNLRGLASWFPARFAIQVALTAAAIAGSLIVAAQYPLTLSAPAALATGFVAGHHAYTYDALLILPLSVIVAERWRQRRVLTMWSLILMTPAPYILLLTEASLAGQIAVSGFVLAVIGRMIHDSRKDRERLLTESGSGLPASS